MGYYSIDDINDYLEHHGILGQKWGVRRFQNYDGSLTAAGKERYIKGTGESSGKNQRLQKKNAYNYVRDYRNGKTSRHEEVKNKIKEATKNERAEWEKANKELAKKRTDLDWKEYLEFENNGWKLSQSRMDHYESLFNKSKEHASYQKAAKKYSDAINREVDAFFGKYADKEFDRGHTIRDDFIDKKIEHLSQYKVLKHSDDFLAHHGILGQKWGHRNGPPYPLNSGAHSAAEKKAGWRKSFKNKADSIKQKTKEKLEEKKKKKKEELHKKHMSDPATMYRYKDEFTIEEIDAAVRRFGAEKRLKDITPNAFREVSGFVKTLSDFSSSGIKLHDNINKTLNAYDPHNKTRVIIGGDKKKKEDNKK